MTAIPNSNEANSKNLESAIYDGFHPFETNSDCIASNTSINDEDATLMDGINDKNINNTQRKGQSSIDNLDTSQLNSTTLTLDDNKEQCVESEIKPLKLNVNLERDLSCDTGSSKTAENNNVPNNCKAKKSTLTNVDLTKLPKLPNFPPVSSFRSLPSNMLDMTDTTHATHGTEAATSNENSSETASASTRVQTSGTRGQAKYMWSLHDALGRVMMLDNTGKFDNITKFCELLIEGCIAPYNYDYNSFLRNLSSLCEDDDEVWDFFDYSFERVSLDFTSHNLTRQQLDLLVNLICNTLKFYEKYVVPKLTNQNTDDMKESLNEQMTGNTASADEEFEVNFTSVVSNVQEIKKKLSSEDYKLYLIQLTKYGLVRNRVNNIDILNCYERMVNSIYDLLGCKYDEKMRIMFESAADCIGQSNNNNNNNNNNSINAASKQPKSPK